MSPPDPKLIRVVRLVSLALLVLAVCFRFVGLDRKVYWHDEAYTSMVITARPGSYLSNELFQNKLVHPADLLAYQQFVPTLSLTDMIVRKGVEDAQHPPLYYILLRFWAQVWGTSPTVTRGFTALLSLLMFPAVYWFCIELFESSLVGWVAIALFAVSPLQLVFAQEARQYGFWAILSLASSTLLLRAIRMSSWRNWLLYGVSMVAALYTALFAVWLAVSHVVYTLVVDQANQLFSLPPRLGKRTIACVITLMVAFVLFIPWMSFVVTSTGLLGRSTSWITVPLPLMISIQMTLFNFSRSFVDFNFELSNPLAYGFATLLLLLQGYATYVLCRTTPTRIGWFLVTFVGGTALAFGLPDLLSGGQRFTVTRYLIPCFIGLQLAVAYLLATYFTQRQRWKVRLATGVFSLLLVLGIASCSVYTQANTWWSKVLNSNYHQVAAIVNGSDRPLIISDAFGYNAASMISLSYLLKPEAQFLLMPAVGNDFPLGALPQGSHSIFLMNLPDVFRRQFVAKYQRQLKSVFHDPWNDLWKVQ
ncbi:MAG: glycosyltransferase family 39 protein [Lyngbya sp. HA4199-MV5]|jgi:uncharacterized membrane protein|nr:glycosyltransferase family 39 protein [Lyngbya sp. HA4199-MV5]